MRPAQKFKFEEFSIFLAKASIFRLYNNFWPGCFPSPSQLQEVSWVRSFSVAHSGVSVMGNCWPSSAPSDAKPDPTVWEEDVDTCVHLVTKLRPMEKGKMSSDHKNMRLMLSRLSLKCYLCQNQALLALLFYRPKCREHIAVCTVKFRGNKGSVERNVPMTRCSNSCNDIRDNSGRSGVKSFISQF